MKLRIQFDLDVADGLLAADYAPTAIAAAETLWRGLKPNAKPSVHWQILEVVTVGATDMPEVSR